MQEILLVFLNKEATEGSRIKEKFFNNGGDFIGVVEGFNKKYDKQIYTSDTEIEVILLTPNTRHIYFKTLNEKKQEDIQSYSNNKYIKYVND